MVAIVPYLLRMHTTTKRHADGLFFYHARLLIFILTVFLALFRSVVGSPTKYHLRQNQQYLSEPNVFHFSKLIYKVGMNGVDEIRRANAEREGKKNYLFEFIKIIICIKHA